MLSLGNMITYCVVNVTENGGYIFYITSVSPIKLDFLLLVIKNLLNYWSKKLIKFLNKYL